MSPCARRSNCNGNKRVGHLATETFLMLNGYELNATDDAQESIIVRLAAGELQRPELESWLREHIAPRK